MRDAGGDQQEPAHGRRVERIAEKHEHFVGIKHAANDLSFATQMLQRFGIDFDSCMVFVSCA